MNSITNASAYLLKLFQENLIMTKKVNDLYKKTLPAEGLTVCVKDLSAMDDTDKAYKAYDPYAGQIGRAVPTAATPLPYLMPVAYYENLYLVAELVAAGQATLRLAGCFLSSQEATLLATAGHEFHYDAASDVYLAMSVPRWAPDVAQKVPVGLVTSAARLVRSVLGYPAYGHPAYGHGVGQPPVPAPPSTTIQVNRNWKGVDPEPDPCDPQWTPDQIAKAMSSKTGDACTCASHFKAFGTHATLCPLRKG